jgi:hypothetical protein
LIPREPAGGGGGAFRAAGSRFAAVAAAAAAGARPCAAGWASLGWLVPGQQAFSALTKRFKAGSGCELAVREVIHRPRAWNRAGPFSWTLCSRKTRLPKDEIRRSYSLRSSPPAALAADSRPSSRRSLSLSVCSLPMNQEPVLEALCNPGRPGSG